MIIITGGAGFIGAHLAHRLAARGVRNIVVCDSFSAPHKWKNLIGLSLFDVVHPDDLMPFLEENKKHIQVLFHLGAIVDDDDVDALVRTNFKLSMNLLNWCSRARVRMIYTSTAATYGTQQKDAIDGYDCATLSALQPETAYGWSKHLFDQAVAEIRQSPDRSYPLPPQYVGLKLFHVYGGQENHKPVENRSFVTQYCDQALTENIIRIHRSHHPDAGQWHDFVHIDDCIQVMLWLYDHPDTSGLFNVGSGQSRNLTDLATMIFAHMGREPVIETRSALDRQPPHYHYCSQADVRSLKAAGYKEPFISLEDGVKSHIDSLTP